MADQTTPNLGLIKPEPGGSDWTWGEKLNADMDTLDAIIAAEHKADGTHKTIHLDAQSPIVWPEPLSEDGVVQCIRFHDSPAGFHIRTEGIQRRIYFKSYANIELFMVDNGDLFFSRFSLTPGFQQVFRGDSSNGWGVICSVTRPVDTGHLRYSCGNHGDQFQLWNWNAVVINAGRLSVNQVGGVEALDVNGNIAVGAADAILLGPAAVDNSYRLCQSGGELVLQQRQSGSWTTVNTLSQQAAPTARALCNCYLLADQTIFAGVETPIQFSFTLVDTDSMFDPSTSATDFTIPAAGYYRITIQTNQTVQYSSGSTIYRIYADSNEIYQRSVNHEGGFPVVGAGSTLLPLTAGQVLRFTAESLSGSATLTSLQSTFNVIIEQVG